VFLPPLLSVLPLPAPDLPVGPAPPALALPHFPDRLHAFVFRNWQLVPPDRMAKVIGARRDDVVRIGRTMGLQGPPRISADQWRRSYLTVIRRNWHLLPYDQLLTLLGWSAEQLAFTLREDDFLYVKLGSLKPRCEPLRYQPPDDAARARAAEIARTLREEFPSGVGLVRRPLFEFVRELSSRPAATLKPREAGSGPRFCYSYFGLYGDPLADPRNDPYPDGYLARLAACGVNGVWLQAVLNKLQPFPWDPSVSAAYEARLSTLAKLVDRAKRRGIRVYLYLNEPRAMRLSFYDNHPELKGATEGDHAAMCTSVPAVRDYLSRSVEGICRAVPDLGGFFTITMSENLTNCWSHGGSATCPRCSARSGADGIAEVNRALAAGIRAAGTRQQLIAWDWGWPDEWADQAISGLPSDAVFMSVSEWSLPIERGGIRSTVGEYSISSVGPGPRARRNWAIARSKGLRTLAKIQAAATWEMSALPYIPALRLVARHARNLRDEKLDGVMLGWTLGGYPSPNLEVVARVLGGTDPDSALKGAAASRFGKGAAADVVQAWDEASEAFAEFPYHVGVVYTGPQHVGPANLLWATPTNYTATMVGFPYDDLRSWRAIYPADVFARQMDAVASGFSRAAETLLRAASEHKASRGALRAEAGLMKACALHFASVADQARFVELRDGPKPPDGPARRAAGMEQILSAEIARARELYELQMDDPRIGFEASNHYYYVPMDLAEKVLNCVRLRSELR